MIYSCFDQKSGLYKYFQDDKQIPVNGDLPVPTWLKSRSTKLGVPALEAGRPLPSNARPSGHGPTARGMIVSCDRSLSGLGASPLTDEAKANLFVAAALGTAALLWWTDQKLSAVAVGGVTLAAVVL